MRSAPPSLTLLALGRLFLAVALTFCPMVRPNAAPAAGVAPVPVPTAPVEEHEHEQKPTGQSQSQPEEEKLHRHDWRVSLSSGRAAGAFSLCQKLTVHPGIALQRSSALDPFRNGLGTPFRC